MRVIKKYPNRRLYDTERSAYITLGDVHDLIRRGDSFKVVDAETGEDITRSILIQIITEQEGGASPMFSTDMLVKFIRFYDDATQHLFGEFLDRSLALFIDQQKKLQDQMGGLMMGSPLTRAMQDLTQRNLEIWQDMQKNFIDLATAATRPPAEETPSGEAADKTGRKKRK